MTLSIVTTLYQSSLHIDEFYMRILKIIKQICDDYEIIFVNDGSPDDSLEKVLALQQINEKIKIIDLARNFGHHQAIMKGLEHSIGNRVFLIDSDLDEAPELLRDFWKILDVNDVDIIIGKQSKRREISVVSNFLHNGFYWIYNGLNPVRLDPNEMVVRLMKRNYVNALVDYQEYNLFLPAVWTDLGFKKEYVLTEKIEASVSSYSLKKKIILSVDAIVSSNASLIYILFFLGVAIFSISILSVLAVLVKWSFYDIELGWTSLIVSVWTGIGLIMMALGIIGIYIAKIYSEVKGRPRTNIRKIYKGKDDV